MFLHQLSRQCRLLLVGGEFVGLGRRGQSDPLAVGPYALEQLPHSGKGPDLRQIAAFEQIAAISLDLISPAISIGLKRPSTCLTRSCSPAAASITRIACPRRRPSA